MGLASTQFRVSKS